MSVRLRTKWLWVRVQLQSLKLQIPRLFRERNSFLDIQATIECGFTLKRVRDMIRTYSVFNLYICLNHSSRYKHNRIGRRGENPTHQKAAISKFRQFLYLSVFVNGETAFLVAFVKYILSKFFQPLYSKL